LQWTEASNNTYGWFKLGVNGSAVYLPADYPTTKGDTDSFTYTLSGLKSGAIDTFQIQYIVNNEASYISNTLSVQVQ
jgi:hypothetical protein